MPEPIELNSVATLLTYGLRVQPDPLQAGGRAELSLIVSNATSDAITCESIQIVLPYGDSASDLIDGSVTTTTEPAPNWTVAIDGGVVSFSAPDGGVQVEGAALVFTVATAANAQPGTAEVSLVETASTDGGSSQQGSGTFSVDKFPADFSLSDVTATDLDIAYGQTAQLNWTLVGAGASSTLDYQPADSGGPVSAAVPNAPGATGYKTQPLTRSGSVTFTLTASVAVLGQDNPLTAQRQLSVSVEALSLEFAVEPPTVGVNGLVRLTWNAPNAQKCELQDGAALAFSGTRYVVLKEAETFTMTAYGVGGQTQQQQRSVAVDGSIQPNMTGYTQTGSPGSTGPNAVPHRARTTEGFIIVRVDPPGNGGPGVNAVCTAALPPLDTTSNPAQVMPITVTGGPGGSGGAGVPDWVGPGAGGNGGDATLTASFDPSQSSPAQFIITIQGGPGGGGGSTGSTGAASATIDGQSLTAP